MLNWWAVWWASETAILQEKQYYLHQNHKSCIFLITLTVLHSWQVVNQTLTVSLALSSISFASWIVVFNLFSRSYAIRSMGLYSCSMHCIPYTKTKAESNNQCCTTLLPRFHTLGWVIPTIHCMCNSVMASLAIYYPEIAHTFALTHVGEWLNSDIKFS